MLVVTGKRKVKPIFRKNSSTECLLLLPVDVPLQRVHSTKQPLTSDSSGDDYGVAISQFKQKMLSGCRCITSFFTFAPTHQFYTGLRACKKGKIKKKQHKPDEAMKVCRIKHSTLRLTAQWYVPYNKYIPEKFPSLLYTPNT